MGWVQKRRNLGNLIFVDLRDRTGIVQLVFSQEFGRDAWQAADKIRSEYVIEAQGKVVAWRDDAINPKMKTGKVEVEIATLKVLNTAKTPPFYIQDGINVSANLRMKYRYLDLRRPEMLWSLLIRNQITQDAHHPFTMPNEEDLHYLDDGEDSHKAHAQSYDIVLNGYELGGGSIRIHKRDIQEKMLKALGISPERAQERFGFLLDALTYGFPPHGGLAIGLDHFTMLLAGKDNIREVIAFPKNSKASDPLTDAPSQVSKQQLADLDLDIEQPGKD